MNNIKKIYAYCKSLANNKENKSKKINLEYI
jgi:hypothetical protein